MEDNKIRQLAKKIQHSQTFQELHDIIMVYAKAELEFVDYPESMPRGYEPTGGKQKYEYYYDNALKKRVPGIDVNTYGTSQADLKIAQKFEDLKMAVDMDTKSQKFEDLKKQDHFNKARLARLKATRALTDYTNNYE